MGKPNEFYILLRGFDRAILRSANWACHGRNGVYNQGEMGPVPEPGDKIIKVREVKSKRRKRK